MMKNVDLLSSVDTNILMKLQYEFPLTNTPYRDVAKELNLDVSDLISRLKALYKAGLIKRVGFYYNYRARGEVSALVAFPLDGDAKKLIVMLNNDSRVTHNYLRDHPVYKVWVVVRRKNLDDLIEHVRSLARAAGIKSWLVLPSRRTYKLSVKFDLIKGHSRSGPYSLVPENIPRPEDLGVSPKLVERLRFIPIAEDPYVSLAIEIGVSSSKVISLINRLLRHGILLDPGATLNGRLLGFNVNAMLVSKGGKDVCRCLSSAPYTTHVVQREVLGTGSWKYDCYAMIHARSRAVMSRIISETLKSCALEDYKVIYSVKDLKPNVVR